MAFLLRGSLRKSLLKFANDVSYVLAALHQIRLWPTFALLDRANTQTLTYTHAHCMGKFIIAGRIILINYAAALRNMRCSRKYATNFEPSCRHFFFARLHSGLVHWQQRMLWSVGTFLIRAATKESFFSPPPSSCCQSTTATPSGGGKLKIQDGKKVLPKSIR